ncbi:unnamed protein product [Lactuca saligna]|uniref:No apical meristem-associated C-terminal domain-containing protein n=1 Tax=Lactuca saligna TaxID=75948 RepID=A0AA35UPP6_LACSI|nr:unnamed protein product [Lactuca saligna]
MLLAKAWLQISEDSITGSQQRDKEFWRRTTAYYEKSNTSNVARTQANLKTHWHYMNPFAVAFNQMYIVLKSQHLSGWFTASGASMSSSNTESFINLDNDEVTTRPIGRNAAKKAAKGKATNSTSSSGNRLDEILEKHIEENKKTFERYQNSLDMKNALKERKMKIKEEKVKNDEISIIFMDPTTMSEDGREIWRNRCDEIKIKYNMK